MKTLAFLGHLAVNSAAFDLEAIILVTNPAVCDSHFWKWPKPWKGKSEYFKPYF